MKKILAAVSLLALAACGVNSPAASNLNDSMELHRISVPADEIISAAHWIKPMTGPYYEVSGSFRCVVVVNEFPPFGGSESCSIEVNGEASVVAKPELLIAELQKVKPMTGPYYRVDGKFIAKAIAKEVPPYGVEKTAELFFAY